MNLLIAQAQILNNLLSLITIFWQFSIWRKKIKQKLQQHGKWFVGLTIRTLYVVQMHNGWQFAKMITTFITRLISIFKQNFINRSASSLGPSVGCYTIGTSSIGPDAISCIGNMSCNMSWRSAYFIRFSWTWSLGISEEVCADDDSPLKTQGL